MCGNVLNFAECFNDGYKKLIGANFCRDRMCPMCNWRRARKLQFQIFQIIHEAVKREKMRFVFLTLTVRNVSGDQLNDTVTKVLKGFKKLMERKEVDAVTVGHVRNLEITYNRKRDDYHPHIHVLLAVKPSYFGEGYITQERWIEMWQKSCGLDYEPVVDVRAIKQRGKNDSLADAACELGKYSAKDSDYIHEKRPRLTDKVTKVLATALKGRRLIGFGKLFRQLHKELNLTDVEGKDVDLVSGEEENCNCPICGSGLREQLYRWNYGAREYVSE
jgi:plasmid rolling circle replication initiator protein Rep